MRASVARALARPGAGTVFWLALFASVLATGSAVLGRDSNLPIHLAYGRAIVAAGGIPDVDPTVYTTTPTDPVILHEWGAEAVFAVVYAAAGFPGLVCGLAIVAATLPVVQYHRALSAGRSFWVALGASGVLGFAELLFLAVRPHVASWGLVLVAWAILDAWRRGRLPIATTVAGIAVVAVVWVNVHGSVLLLFPLIGVASTRLVAGGDRGRVLAELSAITVVVGLGCLVNPAGPALWAHVFAFLAHTPENVAADMRPPGLGNGAVLVIGAVAASIWLPCLARRREIEPAHWVLLAGFTVASLAAVRNLPYLVLLGGPIAAEHADAWLKAAPFGATLRASGERLAEEQRGRSGHLWTMAVAGAVSAVLCVARPVPYGFEGPSVPTEAISWLGAHPEVAGRRGYAGHSASGYLLHGVVERVYLHALSANVPWRLMDDLAVLHDARDGWRRLLDRHTVAWVLTGPGQPLRDALDADPCWTLVLDGARDAIHLRRPECAP